MDNHNPEHIGSVVARIVDRHTEDLLKRMQENQRKMAQVRRFCVVLCVVSAIVYAAFIVLMVRHG